MADELFFPPIGPDVGVGEEYTANNGVTYMWRPEYSTWMIGSSQQVNKDYVDSRDQLRLRVDGLNHMYGDITFKEDADALSDTTLVIKQNGIIELGGSKTIKFVGDGGKITVGDTPFLEFDNSLNKVHKTIHYDTSVTTLQQYSGSNTVVLFDNTSTSNSALTVVDFGKGGIKFRHGNTSTGLHIGSNGYTSVTSNSSTAFIVNSGAFKVDGTDNRVYVSEKQNNELIDSIDSINSLPDTLVATKGYVDNNSTNPGVAVVAESEAEAQVNGFWRNGNNLYLRVS